MEPLLLDFIADHIELTEDNKQFIENMIVTKRYKKGALVLKEGEKSEDSYWVIKGCLRSYFLVDGKEKTTEFYTEQDVVAPVCVVDKKPSQYFISCEEDAVLLVSNPKLEESGFAQFPQFEKLCRLMSEIQSAKKQAALDNFKLSNPEQRYIHLLQTRPELLQRVPQHQLASYLGILPQSLSRLRKRIISK